jgi:hypothetical protein
MKKIICFSLLFLFIKTQVAHSCKCRTSDFTTEVNETPRIFIGSVISETRSDMAYFLFIVSHTYKGEKADTVTIRTGFGGPDCGFKFEKGRSYLVFAWHDNTTGWCSRTGPSIANPDVAKLNYLFDSSYSGKIGKDKEPELNESEAHYLNLDMVNKRLNGTTVFDFNFKRIAFFEDANLKDKQYYFNKWGGKEAATFLYILTPEEKKVTNGYDAIIIVTKRLPGRKGFRKMLIRRLR